MTPAALHHGISSLQDELLKKIIHCLLQVHRDGVKEGHLELGRRLINAHEEVRRLTFVNRRFRDLVFNVLYAINMGSVSV